jgi:hypothetical protein
MFKKNAILVLIASFLTPLSSFAGNKPLCKVWHNGAASIQTYSIFVGHSQVPYETYTQGMLESDLRFENRFSQELSLMQQEGACEGSVFVSGSDDAPVLLNGSIESQLNVADHNALLNLINMPDPTDNNAVGLVNTTQQVVANTGVTPTVGDTSIVTERKVLDLILGDQAVSTYSDAQVEKKYSQVQAAAAQ